MGELCPHQNWRLSLLSCVSFGKHHVAQQQLCDFLVEQTSAALSMLPACYTTIEYG